jgi:hypothetical protein
MNLPPYSHALERSDLKRYPMEIDKIPNRGSAAAAAPERESSFPEIAAEVEEQTNQPATQLRTFSTKPAKPFAFWQNGDFGFGDFLDIINPLQHIPIVATLYRNMSGDTIGAAPRVIGGALWGRIGGLISGAVNAVVDWFTGKDVGDYIYTALFGSGSSTDQTIMARPVGQKDEPKELQSELTQNSRQGTTLAAIPSRPFAEEGWVEIPAPLHSAAAAATSQVAQSETPLTATNVSAVSSYEQNAVVNQPMADSKFRFFA